MKKKMVAVLLSAAMAAAMTACGGGSSKEEAPAPAETSETEEGEESEAEAPAETSEASGGEFKVGLITDVGGVNDGSFNQSSWEGLQRAMDELGIEANYLESATDADYVPNIETFVDEDYDLIISVGYMLADATKTAAEANPDCRFAIIDDASIDLDNVTCLNIRQVTPHILEWFWETGQLSGCTVSLSFTTRSKQTEKIHFPYCISHGVRYYTGPANKKEVFV